ncbi:MAG TPA: hypothetical protein VHB97_06925 [Polyangia bacterium]|nr:hypothetical protein [Polyangia bacterium]
MDDAALTKFLDAAFAFACQRRVGEFVDIERLLAAVDVAAEPSRVARLVARFAAPMRARVLERLRASSLPIGVWLPDPVREAIAALLAEPAPIPRALVDSVVADEHVRDSARAMLQEALSSFIHKAFSVTPGGRGLRGVIGLGARAAGGLFGGIGDEIQRQLEERVRDFVDGGVGMMQKSVAQRLTSAETARLLGKRRRAMFLALLAQPESQLARFVGKTPWDALEAMIPAVIAHNLPRAELRAALREEIAAVVTELSATTIGELLDELGLRAQATEALRAHGLPLARAFLASPEFSALGNVI